MVTFDLQNLIVNTGSEGDVEISEIVDWGTAGFYPDYYEATKVTNTLSLVDLNDWYLFLPTEISTKMAA
jgi:hypothetical protein